MFFTGRQEKKQYIWLFFLTAELSEDNVHWSTQAPSRMESLVLLSNYSHPGMIMTAEECWELGSYLFMQKGNTIQNNDKNMEKYINTV